MWSRELLKKGLRWRVCNGEKIAKFKDQWITGLQSRLPPNPSVERDFETVSTLLHEGAWNEPLVHFLFPPYVVQNILSIPISTTQSADSRLWVLDQKGKYLVNDGYKLEIGFYDSPNNSSEVKSKEWWKFVWALSVPPKVRIFWWRVLHNIIPTETNLLVHHVPVRGYCRLCHHEYDTTSHALFWCPVITTCWKGTTFGHSLKQVRHWDIMAIREGIHVVRDRGSEIHEITIDSFLTVQAVTHPEEDLSYSGVIATDNKDLLENHIHVKLSHARRISNIVAHSFANFAISSPSPFV